MAGAGFLRVLMGALVLVPAASPAAYDPAPWLADLAQIRAAFNSDYANLEWLAERSPSVDERFEVAAGRIKSADSDLGAKRAIERLVERMHDGHIQVSWPQPAATPSPAGDQPKAVAKAVDAKAMCSGLGYGAVLPSVGTIAKLPGYQALPAGPVPAGTIKSGDTTVGAIRIGLFTTEAFPEVCETAVAALKLPLDKPCEDACSDKLTTRVYADLTAAIAARIAELRAAGATVLLVDVSGNGGGSEWAEAVARMFTPKPLKPAPWSIARTKAWSDQWTKNTATLTNAAAKARGEEKRILLEGAASTRQFAAETARDCTKDACSRLAKGGYATGLLAAPPAVAIKDEAASAILWSPAQFHAPVGAWQGPLIVLTDSETWSAAEELPATLQDNKAAVVLGGRTGGAGCGHASGADPITLKNSGGKLVLPDCVRFRFDGTNEVAGVIPDVETGHRADDSDALKAKLVAAKLPEAIALARTLQP